MSEQSLIIYQRPKLAKPYLVMGFEGWPDAGKVSSGAIAYLRDKLACRKLAEVKPDDFYLFQSPGAEVGRPVTDIEGGLVKALSRPTTTFWFYKTKGSSHDLVLMLGREPELRWGDYVSLILDLAQDFGVVRIYTIGGTYDVVPHTIEPLLGVVLSDSSLEAEMRGYGVQPINYKGPSSVHTTLLVSASERHIEMVSLWGYVPHYVQVPNTKVCYRVLSELARMLDIALNLDDIRQQSVQLDDMIDKAISQKPELQDYVRRLEAEYSQGRYEAGETLKEDIIKDIEDFLRKRGDE